MTYEEARAYMTEIGKTGSIPGLLSIRNLMDELGNVQKELSVLHIAGTNGKGSVGAFLESALLEAGRHVGRYTSPAVFSPLSFYSLHRPYALYSIGWTNKSQELFSACFQAILQFLQ